MPTNQAGTDVFPWNFTPMPIEPMFALVRTVEDVSIGFTEGESPSAVIAASGTVPTGGWPFAVLAPKLTTTDAQQSEIWDLLFLGRLPPKDTLLIQKISRIEGSLVTPLPSWVKAIRVIASTGEKLIAVNDAGRVKTLTWASKPAGGSDAFPW